jgi:Na+-transporting NADH:ubiquinone oxidoreductase subunit NqrB
MQIRQIIDPRYYQLAVQSSLLIWGMIYLDFSLDISAITSVIGCALLVQIIFTQYYQLSFNPLSTINSSMSILLLLHASHFSWLALAIALAIASKFVLRWHNRHIFNPSNIGIVAVLLFSDSTWLASGQWGHSLWWSLLLLGLGLSLFIGFSRLLTSLSFLVFFASLIFLRALWLGDNLSIPVHQLQNGALLIFSFFMLSDPMTSPNSAIGRIMFGGLLALIAWILQFTYYIPNAFLYALALASPLVIVINQISWGKYYHWSQTLTRNKLCE